MDNKTNGKGSELSRQPSKIVDPASLSKKLLAADQAKEDASNMYQQENNFKRQMDSSKPSGTPISTRDTSARQMEQAKTKDGNSNASNSTRQNFGRTVIQRNEHHRSGTTQANVGANNNKPTNNTIQNNIIQNNTNTKSNPQVSTPSRLHTASRTNVPPVSNESSKGGNFNARNEFTNRNLGESNQGARIPSPTYNAKNQANVNQTSSYTFNYNRGAFKGNKNFGGNENTVGGESGASYTPPVNRSTNIQPNHIESGSRSGSKENKGTRNGNASNGNAISRGNVASASAITGTSLYSNAVRVSNMSQSEKLQGADKARSDAQQMYQEEDRRRRMREAVEKSNLEKFEERLENHRSKNKISVDLNDVLPPRENRKVVSHYKSVRVEERPLAASKNDRMGPKTKAQHKEKEGAKTRQDVNAQASNKQANNNNKTVGNQGTKTGKIENTRQNTTIKTYKRTSYRMNQEEIKNIKDQIRGASKKSSKLTVKQALGKTMGTTKSVGKAGKTAITDAASAMNSDYAAAEFTKKQANRVGTKIAKAAGVGGALSFAKGGVELLTSDDSAKTMTEVSTKIATKAIDKVIHVDRNLKKRAENEIKKQTKTVGKLDKKYDKLNSKELKLREKADKKYKKAKSKKNPKYKEKADKLTMKADKLRDKHAKANRKLGLKRNKETVRLNNLKAKARKKIARSKVAKKVALKFAAGAAIPLLLLIIIPSMIGGGASFGVYIIKHFVSNAITDFTDTIGGKNTALGKKLAELEKMNWSQFIADETAEHLGETFVKAAQKDSQSHYIDKKILLSTILEESGENEYPKYDWYCNLGEGSIGHVWMREQCDNVTDKDGKMIYDSNGTKGDKNYTEDLLYYPGGKISQMSKNYGYKTTLSYIDEKNRREIGIHENIMPIISMAHARYDDIWTWENYETVEAYVWYMYTLSHNSAHYDDNADGDTGAYSYKSEKPCDQDILATDDYLEKFVYEGGTLKRPVSKKDENGKCNLPCTNIYYHGYTTDTILKDASVENQMKEKIKGTAKGVLSWIDTILGSNTAESIEMPGTFIITYNRVDGVYTNGLGVKSSKDGKVYDSPDEAGKSLGIVKDNNGKEHGCENLGYRKLYDKENKYACGEIAHDHTKDCTYDKCGYSYEHQHTTEYGATSQCTKCGKEHKHDDSCKLTCGYSTEHTHSQLCCKYGLIEHVHKDTCKVKREVYDCNHICGFECHRNGKCLHDSICTLKGCQLRVREVLNCGFSTEHEHKTGDCCSLDEHNHDANCGCKIEEHTCIPSECCSITPHTHIADCCSTTAHTHKEWQSADEPGCYNTFAFCAGHCGGHIKPSVNIAVTYTMEGLAYQDAVALNAGTDKAKDSHWTGKSDFIILKDNLANSKDLAEWTRNANKYCSQWFKAGPNGPISAVSYLTDSLNKSGLKIFKGWQTFWGEVGSTLVNKLFGEEADSSPYYDIPSDQQLADLEKIEAGEDDQGFEGWFVGEGDQMSFNPDLFETLHSLYGDPSDFYALGIENWKSFDVVFNTGFNNRLSEEQVASISNVVKNTYYPNKNTQKVKNRMAIVEEALKASGMYSSSNDLDFATTIYTKALGEEKGNAARDAISKAINGQSANGVFTFKKLGQKDIAPGDILINSTSLVIYLGKYKDPSLGMETHYFVSNTDGNSKTFGYQGLKNLSEISNFLSSYNQVYKVK